MTPMQLEYLQFAPLLVYVIATWQREPAPIKAGLLCWLCVLGWDIFIFKGDRPAGIKWMYNMIDAGAGWVIVYAQYQQPVRRVGVRILSVVLGLFR